DRDGAELPGPALHQEIVRFALQGIPSPAQARIEELQRRSGVVRQSVRIIRRALAVIGIGVADQRFRRTKSGLGDRDGGEQKRNNTRYFRHRRLALFSSTSSIVCV